MFVAAAIGKGTDAAAFESLIVAHGVRSPAIARGVAVSLIALELLGGILAIVGSPFGLALVLGLLALFGAVMARNARRPVPLPCGCFGRDSEPHTRRTLVRIALLLLGALAIELTGQASAPPTVAAIPMAIAWSAAAAWSLESPTLATFVRTKMGPARRPNRYSYREDTNKRVRSMGEM